MRVGVGMQLGGGLMGGWVGRWARKADTRVQVGG